jgi:hypothetical protein
MSPLLTCRCEDGAFPDDVCHAVVSNLIIRGDYHSAMLRVRVLRKLRSQCHTENCWNFQIILPMPFY